jgi:phage tail sheath protein FI
MAQVYNSPGVYRQEVLLKPSPVLQTGVPGFVGFAGAPPGGTLQINRPVALNRKEEFSASFSSANSFLADAVAGFFENGGTRCYVVAADSSMDPVQGLVTAIAALAPLDGIDLVAVPDASRLLRPDDTPDKPSIARVQAEMLSHCAHQGNRFAILDSLPGASVDDVMGQSRELLLGQREPVNGALYYPWLIPSGSSNSVPPCGHVAGIYRRSDLKTGVFKAPANEEIFGVLDLETQIDSSIQDRLNPMRINCLRAFPGRGIRVWGARTVGSARVPPDHDDWLYVNVRRLFLTVRRWIDLNMGWATFEPNDSRLWVRILRELTAFLTKLQRDGALRGATATEAFYVKCDAENNPPELRDLGQVVIEIGLAPLSPAEFIVVRIVRRAGGSPDN